MQITLDYDSTVSAAPTGFTTALQTAVGILDSVIKDPINVTIQIGYGEENGAAITGSTLAEAQDFGSYMSYSQLISDLTTAATSTNDSTFLKGLPTTDPTNGGSFFVSNAELKSWGLSTTGTDGYAGFSSSFTWDFDPSNGISSNTYDIVGVALHELTHALGRTSPDNYFTPLDLLGYGQNGTLDPTNGDVRYLSLDGGKTNVVNFDTTSDPGDFALGSPTDPFNAFLSSGTAYSWTALDTQIMDVLGFNVGAGNPSPSGYVILPGGGTIQDGHGNVWSISPGLQVTVNGAVDPTTAFVIQMDYVNGTIWQENNSGLWYSKVLPTDQWSTGVNNAPIGPPVIAGTMANQQIQPGTSFISLFSNVTITDGVANASEKVTVTEIDASGNPSDLNGTLSGPGLTESDSTPGVYTLAVASPSDVSTALQQLHFMPANASPQTAITTKFAIGVMDSATSLLGGSIASDSSTTVVETAIPQTASLTVFDTTSNLSMAAAATAYSGPVAGLQNQYINITPDSLNITASTANWFLHGGSGNDAIQASSGTNVLDGGTGSNFLVGGRGTDTFFVDDRSASSDIWSTMVNFHSGDAATVFGVTQADFNLSWLDGQGATGYTGLTLHASAAGKPNASLTLAGLTSADLSNGKLSVAFGVESDGSGPFMYIKAA